MSTTPSKPALPTEAQEQAALMRWTQAVRGQYPELALLFHVPNEGQRSTITGAHLRQQGLKRGVPDLMLPVARGGYHGLFVEMKRRNGKAWPDQLWWIEHLRAQGYAAEICHGWEAAKNILEKYLALQERL